MKGKKKRRVLRWGIYHRDREFARETGDPCLGIVRARTKSEAERRAIRAKMFGLTGLWAHPIEES